MFKIDTELKLQEDKGREKSWRDLELSRADIELNKVQDGVGIGTVAQWRSYRTALRDWPKHDRFPQEDFRPVAPDA